MAITQKIKHFERGAFTLEIDSESLAWLIFDQPDSKINTFSEETLNELNYYLDYLISLTGIRVLIFISGKERHFAAGADLKALLPYFNSDDSGLYCLKFIDKGNAIMRRILDLPFPTISAINGMCVGGGLELSLHCKYRVAADNFSTNFWLPEPLHGFVPFWGGVSLLEDLVGLIDCARLFLPAKLISAQEAFKAKIVDQIVPDAMFNKQVGTFVKGCLEPEDNKDILRKRNKKNIWRWLIEENQWGRNVFLFFCNLIVCRRIRQKPLRLPFLGALRILKEIYGLTKKEKLDKEQVILRENIAETYALARNLIPLYFTTKAMMRIPNNTKPMLTSNIAILLDDKEYEKYICPSNSSIRKIALGQSLKNVDVLIDATHEDMNRKRTIATWFQEAQPSALLFTFLPTYSLQDIADIAIQGRTVAFSFLGSFMNAKLIEVATDDLVVAARALQVCQQLRKVPLIVKNNSHCLVRLFLTALTQCDHLVDNGYKLSSIDAELKRFGFAPTPLSLSKEIDKNTLLRMRAKYMMNDTDNKLPPDISIVHALYEAGMDCLKQGFVTDPAYLDVASVLALGFPSWKGGVMRYKNIYPSIH